MKLYRIVLLILCAAFLVGLFSGCAVHSDQPDQDEDKSTIVVTVFPVYDWLLNVLGDRADSFEIVLLMKNGSDLHSFTPGLADMQKIHAADLFICIGGESDSWVADALKGKTNENQICLSLMEHMGSALREEEYVEGMVREQEPEGEEEEAEYDEHIWLSLRNAELACAAITEALSRLDPQDASLFQKNADGYLEQIRALDRRYVETISAAPLHTLVFADRFPFRYLVEDYDLDYYAAYAGCSSEVGTSITTVPFLAGKIDELGLRYVLCLENSGSDLPEKVVSVSKSDQIGILSVNSMQFINSADIEGGATYLGIMEDNLSVFSKALSAD